MKWLIVGIVLVAAWPVGLLAYVNYFSESNRAGRDVVGIAPWVSLLLGIVAIVAGLVASARERSRAGSGRDRMAP